MSTTTPTIAAPAAPPKLPPLDGYTIRAQEHARVTRDLAGLTRAIDRLHAASGIADTAAAEVTRLRPDRARLALSLALYDGVRGLSRVLGVARDRFMDMRREALGWGLGEWPTGPDARHAVAARAAARGVPRIDATTAAAHLPAVAEALARAEERGAAARRERDPLVVALTAIGVDRATIAAIINRRPSRVSQIASKEKP